MAGSDRKSVNFLKSASCCNSVSIAIRLTDYYGRDYAGYPSKMARVSNRSAPELTSVV